MSYYDSFSKLSPEDKLLRAKEMRDEAWYANIEWLDQAEQAHKFKAGDQWTDEEKIKLQQQGREAGVWNHVHPAVELTVGVLSQNPVRIYPYPVETSDGFLCQILEDLVSYVDENQVDADSEETEMFEEAVITGQGDVVVDVGPDPNNPVEIMFEESVMAPYEVLVDPMSRKADFSDARFVMYEKWVTAETFRAKYPKQVKHMEEIFSMGTASMHNAFDNMTTRIESDFAQDAGAYEYYDSQGKRIRVTQMEYRDSYKRYFFSGPDGNVVEIDKKQVKEAKKQPGELIELYDTKIYWMHFIHDRILWEGESPVYSRDFSICRMEAYKDKSKRIHRTYGVVKPMIDPQRECNKRWLHAIRLLGSQGVGVMAEIDAFHDIKQAQESWNDPNAITFLAKRGLSKIQEKSTPAFPDAPMKMEEMSKDSMRHITGINPDLLGVAQQRREPGINLKLRQQQGMTMLSKLFKNYRKARKNIFRRKAEIIVKFMPDSQIRKILGETDKYVFKDGYIIDQKRQLVAPIRKVRDLQYNIRMEDAPGSMNKQITELATFMEMMERGFPVNPFTVIDKLDLTPAEKADWKAFIKEQQDAAAQAKQAEMQSAQANIQLKAQKQQMDGQRDQGKLQLEQKKLQLIEQGKMLDINIARAQLQQKADADQSNVQQRDVASKRDFAAKIAAIEQTNEQKLIDILQFVAEKADNQKLVTPTETGANANSGGITE